MSFNCIDNKVYVGHVTWGDIVGNVSSIPLFEALKSFKNVILNNGAAYILMADESSIAFGMNRLSEVLAVAQIANAKRVALGLTPVDLQEIGL